MTTKIHTSSGFEWPATCCCGGFAHIACCDNNIVIYNGRGEIGVLFPDAQELRLLDLEYDSFFSSIAVGMSLQCCTGGTTLAVSMVLDANRTRQVLALLDTNTGEEIHEGLVTTWNASCCGAFYCRATEVGPDGTSYPWTVLVDRIGTVVENGSVSGTLSATYCNYYSVFRISGDGGIHVFYDGVHKASAGPGWYTERATNFYITLTDGRERRVYYKGELVKTIYGTPSNLTQFPSRTTPDSADLDKERYILADGNDTWYYFYAGELIREFPSLGTAFNFQISGDTVLFKQGTIVTIGPGDFENRHVYTACYRGKIIGSWESRRIAVPPREGSWPGGSGWPSGSNITSEFSALAHIGFAPSNASGFGTTIPDTLIIVERHGTPISLSAYNKNSGAKYGTYYRLSQTATVYYKGDATIVSDEIVPVGLFGTEPQTSTRLSIQNLPCNRGSWSAVYCKSWALETYTHGNISWTTERITSTSGSYTHEYLDADGDPLPANYNSLGYAVCNTYAENGRQVVGSNLYYRDKVVFRSEYELRADLYSCCFPLGDTVQYCWNEGASGIHYAAFYHGRLVGQGPCKGNLRDAYWLGEMTAADVISAGASPNYYFVYEGSDYRNIERYTLYYHTERIGSFDWSQSIRLHNAPDVAILKLGENLVVGYVGGVEVYRGDYYEIPSRPVCGNRVWFHDTAETITVLDPDFGMMRFNIFDLVRYDTL